jgi:hypothetical protein
VAYNTKLSTTFVNSQANVVAAYFNDGFLIIYDGTQPANADTVASGNALVTLRFANPAFASAVNGVITANALSSNIAVNSGTASWFRTTQSDGTTVLLDGSVGSDSGNNLVLGTTVISVGSVISVTGFTHTVAQSTAGS